MVEIIDGKTKKEVKKVIDEEMGELKKTMKKELKGAKKSLGKDVKSAKKTVGKKLEKDWDSVGKKLETEWGIKPAEYIESIKENPVEWVAGAFIAGLLFGGLLRK